MLRGILRNRRLQGCGDSVNFKKHMHFQTCRPPFLQESRNAWIFWSSFGTRFALCIKMCIMSQRFFVKVCSRVT
ncbi:hypothetical protein Plhal304r1_c036g0111561 [Plasmopara halstedii]